MAERSGAKTQLTGVTGAALIILMIVLVPGLFRNLPQPALAAVVITASLSLADIPATVRLWRQRKAEFLLSIAAFLGVALLGVLPGIAIAVGLSILNVFRRAWWPYDTVLGRVDGLEGYHDIHSHPEARHLPGLVIYRFDAPLFFANATTFRDEVRRLARADPPPLWIVIAAEPVTDVDTTASDVLEDLDEALNAQGISLVFAELKDPVRRKIERYGLTRTIDPHHFFPTIESAIAAFRDETGAQWTAAAQPTDGLTAPGQSTGGARPPDIPAAPPGELSVLPETPSRPSVTRCPAGPGFAARAPGFGHQQSVYKAHTRTYRPERAGRGPSTTSTLMTAHVPLAPSSPSPRPT